MVSCKLCAHLRTRKFPEAVVDWCTHEGLPRPRQLRTRNRVSVSRPTLIPVPDWCPIALGEDLTGGD
ncbi:MAG: hypothetical protein WC277_04195 [Bacilli bacterium]